MDSNVTAGTRDLALSGSFAMPVAAVCLLGAKLPVIDRVCRSAAEP